MAFNQDLKLSGVNLKGAATAADAVISGMAKRLVTALLDDGRVLPVTSMARHATIKMSSEPWKTESHLKQDGIFLL